jgi:hypothetical protein
MLTKGETTGTEAVSERKEHEVDLFYEALNRADPAVRAAFLGPACAGQTALRKRLERLLAAHADAEKFFFPVKAAIHVPMGPHRKQ